ncbi:MAG TPA: RDD family protein [Gammaproteobacteria bacterium]|jgi:uncharacterized RDD family membrane protein YckC|nr:RDD family protein [Gammaproteobacteria bacterium]
MIDNKHDIEIPEGLTLHAIPAGPVVRLYAWIIDLLIRAAIYLIVILALSMLGEMGWGLAMIVLFAMEWFYPVFFEVLRDGATPGKKAFGLKVIHDDLTPIGWQASILRNLLRSVDFLPVLYLFGLISILLNKKFQRLGDLAAGTLVIHRHKEDQTLPQFTSPAKAPQQSLIPREQQAILNFAQRYPTMTHARSDELARTTGSLVKSSDDAVAELLSIAKWITGKRD